MNPETAEDLKRWLARGGVEVNKRNMPEILDVIKDIQLANRSRRDYDQIL